jgi:hypothetical protein
VSDINTRYSGDMMSTAGSVKTQMKKTVRKPGELIARNAEEHKNRMQNRYVEEDYTTRPHSIHF